MQTNAELPRCRKCYYTLEGLESARCPECGEPFDFGDPTTFTVRPPFLFWRFWLPGLGLAVGLGVVMLALLLSVGSTGWGLTIAAPVVIGSLIGYRCRVHVAINVLLVISGLVGVVISLVTLHISGMLCAIVSFLVLLAPTLIGTLLGVALRNRLKRSDFPQRLYFPMILWLLMPLGVAAIEAMIGKDVATEVVRTSRVLPVGVEEAWGRLAFYEDLPEEKPWLLRWAGPVPVRTTTSKEDGGVTRTCIYERGYLRKQVTSVEKNVALRFRVIDQHVGEERAVRILDGAFEFEALGPNETRVTLETRYQPKLGPRFCWRFFERLVNGQVHEHVLAGMATGAPGSSTLARAVARAAP
ncbi:MAG TPA: SRPBCC family protein [Phycisphaerae bacterium]|nr:SRPBCC family protein [Phycisphaerae bacterium]HRW51349.1 SRPBCC family protein [Phycisphaerae bacterium]